MASSVDPDNLEAFSLGGRVGLRTGRVLVRRRLNDAELKNHPTVRRWSILGACEELRDLGMHALIPQRPIIHGDSHSRPSAGRSVCVLKQEVRESQGPGSPCARRHNTPSRRTSRRQPRWSSGQSTRSDGSPDHPRRHRQASVP